MDLLETILALVLLGYKVTTSLVAVLLVLLIFLEVSYKILKRLQLLYFPKGEEKLNQNVECFAEVIYPRDPMHLYALVERRKDWKCNFSATIEPGSNSSSLKKIFSEISVSSR